MDGNEDKKVDDNIMKMTRSTVIMKSMWRVIMIMMKTVNFGQGREQAGKGTWKLSDQFGDSMDEDGSYDIVDDEDRKEDKVDENGNYNVDENDNDDNR